MRQVLIAALLIVAALAATNCSTAPQPSSSANYYMPPKSCVDNDASIRRCFTDYDECTANTTTCTIVDVCFALKMRCLEGTTTTNSNCTTWASGLENFGLYLIAGGSYKDSSLEQACQWAVCRAAQDAVKKNIRDASGNVCQPNLAAVCVAPNFEAPTRGPTQAVYSITFGGEWAALLAGLTKESPKYREIESAIQKGLSKLLGVPEHLITILEMSVGSLVVKFIVNSDRVSFEQVRLALESLLTDKTLVNNLFQELATAAGFELSVTGVGAEDNSTPAPPASAMSTSALVAMLLAIVAAMLF